MLFFSYANLAPGQYGWRYSDLEKGAVEIQTYDGPVTVNLIRVNNTQKAWQEVTSKNMDCMCRIYVVDLSDTHIPDSYIENLQYFFIRADRVHNPGQNSPQLGLLIQGGYTYHCWLESARGIIFCTVLSVKSPVITAIRFIIPQMSGKGLQCCPDALCRCCILLPRLRRIVSVKVIQDILPWTIFAAHSSRMPILVGSS